MICKYVKLVLILQGMVKMLGGWDRGVRSEMQEAQGGVRWKWSWMVWWILNNGLHELGIPIYASLVHNPERPASSKQHWTKGFDFYHACFLIFMIFICGTWFSTISFKNIYRGRDVRGSCTNNVNAKYVFGPPLLACSTASDNPITIITSWSYDRNMQPRKQIFSGPT